MTIGETIKKIREEKGMTQEELSNKLGYKTKSSISKIEKSLAEFPISKLRKIADALDVDVWEIIGFNSVEIDDINSLNVFSIHKNAVPILGDIACGTPITAEQNMDGYADLPDGVRADFALKCKGDSMEPTFLDGDLVLIRQEGDVSDGRIAAVLLDSETDTEATLKRVHHIPGGLILIPDNQKKYGPRTFQGTEAAKVRILGVAVGYVRMI